LPLLECTRCNALSPAGADDAEFVCALCGERNARRLEMEDAAAAEAAARTPSAGDHCAALYRGPAAGAELVASFVEEGVRAGELVALQVDSAMRTELERTLPREVAAQAWWVDVTDLMRGRLGLEGMAERVQALVRGSRPVRIVGSHACVPDQRIDARAIRLYELLVHELVVRHGITALCLYDSEACDESHLSVALETHPLTHREGALRRNPDFVWVAAA
jgi:hypothetical protein